MTPDPKKVAADITLVDQHVDAILTLAVEKVNGPKANQVLSILAKAQADLETL